MQDGRLRAPWTASQLFSSQDLHPRPPHPHWTLSAELLKGESAEMSPSRWLIKPWWSWGATSHAVNVLFTVSSFCFCCWRQQFVLFWHTGAARVETAASETGTASSAWTDGTVVRTETEGWTGRVSPSLNAASAGRARTGLEPETCAVSPAWLTRESAGAETGPPAGRQRVTNHLYYCYEG